MGKYQWRKLCSLWMYKVIIELINCMVSFSLLDGTHTHTHTFLYSIFYWSLSLTEWIILICEESEENVSKHLHWSIQTCRDHQSFYLFLSLSTKTKTKCISICRQNNCFHLYLILTQVIVFVASTFKQKNIP